MIDRSLSLPNRLLNQIAQRVAQLPAPSPVTISGAKGPVPAQPGDQEAVAYSRARTYARVDSSAIQHDSAQFPNHARTALGSEPWQRRTPLHSLMLKLAPFWSLPAT